MTQNRRRPRTLRRLALTTALGAALLAAPSAHAAPTEVLYATTTGNELVSFTAQAPNVVRTRAPIGGLASSETIVGMDQRPATGQLYALTSAGRILVIERDSGDTRAITSTALTLSGTSFGFDFNPVADRIRIVSDAELNLRVHPDTGIATPDGALAYGAGDPGAGTNPSVGAAAYTNSAFGPDAPASTTLFDVDSARDALVRQDPPNDGGLVTVGSLGVAATEPVQLAITGSGDALAAFTAAGESAPRLWSIALGTGAATPAALSPRIGAGAITSLASVGGIEADTTAPTVAVGNFTTWRGVWLTKDLRFTVTCVSDCIVDSTLRIGSTVAGTVRTEIPVAGTRAPEIELNESARRLAARSGRLDASLTFLVRDSANNKRTQVARFESLPGLNPVS